MELSAGDYNISGSKDQRIHIRWSVRDADQLSRVRASADVHGADASIVTDGPSNNSLKFDIQVPERSDLYVRMTAGDIRIEDVRGNKDIELHAGDVRIDVGRADDYKQRGRVGLGRRHQGRTVQHDQGRVVPLVRVERPRPVSSARQAEGGRHPVVLESRPIIRG